MKEISWITVKISLTTGYIGVANKQSQCNRTGTYKRKMSIKTTTIRTTDYLVDLHV